VLSPGSKRGILFRSGPCLSSVSLLQSRALGSIYIDPWCLPGLSFCLPLPITPLSTSLLCRADSFCSRRRVLGQKKVLHVFSSFNSFPLRLYRNFLRKREEGLLPKNHTSWLMWLTDKEARILFSSLSRKKKNNTKTSQRGNGRQAGKAQPLIKAEKTRTEGQEQ